MNNRILRNALVFAAAVFSAAACHAQLQLQTPFALPGTTAVGQQSVAVPVTVMMTASGTSAAPQVIVQGTATPGPAPADFVLASTAGTCAAGQPYTTGTQCTVNVVFQPSFPGQRTGAVQVLSATGALLGSQLIVGSATGSLPVLLPGAIQTVAGDGAWIYNKDGIPAVAANIFLPMGVVTDAAGNFYLSDSNNNRIRFVNFQSGLISTFAGTGTPGYSGDGGLATAAMINTPSSIVMDGAGNIYFADSGNDIIRRIDAVTGIITTVAGTPQTEGFSGDNGPATSAHLTTPEGVAFDAAGDLIIADTGNQAIRKVDVKTGVITTIAGVGNGTSGYKGDGGPATSALLGEPWGIAYGADGVTLYIADMNNNVVRSVNSLGIIQTVVGNGQRGYAGDGSNVSQAILNNPASVAFDPAGDLFVADSGNNRVRMVSSGTQIIETVAGNGLEEYDGDGLQANLADLYGPYAINIDGYGNLYIADMFHQRIREVTADALAFQYATMRVGQTSPPQIAALANEGNSNLDITSYIKNQTALDAATTTCVIGSAEAAGNNCNLGVEFAPTVVGTNVTGSLTVNSNAPNVLPVISVSGDVLSVNPTSISLTTSGSPSLVGQPVTFTASVSSSNSALTGTVTFFDGPTQICSQTIASNAATCTTASLTLGSHNITANYSGDTTDAAANSTVLVQVVQQSPAVALTVNPSPSATVGTSVTLTATVTAPTGTPTGSVVFYDGTNPIGTGTLNPSGVATSSTSSLTPGTHSLTAQYSGDTTNAAATSNAVTETINQATTTTTIATSNGNVPVGTAVTFTANVTGSSSADAPTGNVTFTANGTTGPIALGPGTLNPSGVAAVTTSALAPGTYTVVAVYAGDTNNSGSTSVGIVEIVTQLGTTTALSVSPNPANAGATVTMTANVAIATGATADGPITGTVTFTDGGTVIGTGMVNASGQATFTTAALSATTHAIIATYSGNTNYAKSSSSAVGEVINTTSTTTALGANPLTVTAGQNETLTATVTSATGGIPTGTVLFKDGSATLGPGTLSAGVAMFSTTNLSVGTHTITAVYGGDGNYLTSTSSPVTVVVQLAPTATALSTSANPSVVGQPLTLMAAVTSVSPNITGSINFMDGATLLLSVPVNSGTATYTTSGLTFGTHSLTAVYAGDSIHATSTSPAVSEQIVETAPETVQPNINPATSGTNVTFTATITGQNGVMPTGQVTFKDVTSGTTLGTVTVTGGVATYSTSTLSVGTHTISATYSGDNNYAAATATCTETITNANTQIALTASANPATYATPVSLTAVITSNGGIATGIVTFTDGAATVGTAPIDATGKAVLTTSSLAPGTHSIVANYAGDGKASASVSTPLALVVDELTQTVVTSSANPATTLSPVTFTATVTNAGVGVPTGSVTFTDNGTTSLGPGTLNANGVATITVPSLTAGTHSIVATYAGDGSDFASTSAALVETVNLRPTTTSLTGIPTDPANPNEVTLVAVVAGFGTPSPTGTVTFTFGSITLGSATVGSTGVATLQIFLQQPTENIVASYGGDTNYAPSTSPITAISTGTATQFSINVTPGSATLVSKQRTTVTVTLTSLGSFTDKMNLGCLGLPYAATCTFSSDSVKLNANGTVSAQLTIDTGDPLGAGSQATNHGLTNFNKSGVLECLLPLGMLLGFGLRRRRKLVSLLAVLMVAALTLTVSGCAGLNINGTPAGTYNFTVGATGAGTGASESQTFTLTVTQ